MAANRLEKLEKQLAELFTARPQFAIAEALTFGQPGERIRVRVPGKPRRYVRAIAATVINSTEVSIAVDSAGRTWAFCSSAPSIQHITPGQQFHSRPVNPVEVTPIPQIAYLLLDARPVEGYQSLGWQYFVFIDGRYIRLPINFPSDFDVNLTLLDDPLAQLDYIHRARVIPSSGRITMGKDGSWQVDLVFWKVTSTTGNGNYPPPFDVYNTPFDLERIRESFLFTYTSAGQATRRRIFLEASIAGDTAPIGSGALAAYNYRNFNGYFYTLGAGYAVASETSNGNGNDPLRISNASGYYHYFLDQEQVSSQPFNQVGFNNHSTDVAQTVELLPYGIQTGTNRYLSTNDGNISYPTATYTQIDHWLPLKLNPERTRGAGVRLLFTGSQNVIGTLSGGAPPGQPSFDTVNAALRGNFEFYLATSAGVVSSTGAGAIIKPLLDGDPDSLDDYRIIGPTNARVPAGITVLDDDEGFIFVRPFTLPSGENQQITLQLRFYSEDLTTFADVELEAIAPPSGYTVLDYAVTPGQITP